MKIVKTAGILLSIFTVSFAFGQTPKKKPAIVEQIPMTYEVTNLGQKMFDEQGGIQSFNALLLLVATHRNPTKDTVFAWKKSTYRIPVESIHLVYTTSIDPVYLKNKANSEKLVPSGPRMENSSTMVKVSSDKNIKPLVSVFLLLDKIFYDADQREYPDAVIRYISALAYELYGDVAANLTLTPKQLMDRDRNRRFNIQITSYQNEIDFLKSVIAEFSKKEKFLGYVPDLQSKLASEEIALRQWQEKQSKLK